MSALVRFDNVSFTYGDASAYALDSVTFCVDKGEVCTIVGPNGCGKSTALRLLLGLDNPTAGTVSFDGQLITADSLANRVFAKRLRQRVGLVFQDPDVQLFCPTVYDEIAFGPLQMGLEDAEVKRRVADCLELFGLQTLADRAPWRLSGGEKRRCALACVVSLAPDLLCLDEPTNGLDEQSYDQLVTFLRSFAQAGKTVLVATHDMSFVKDIGARVIRL